MQRQHGKLLIGQVCANSRAKFGLDLSLLRHNSLVDNRPRTGKIKIGGTDVAQNVRRQ